MGFVSTEEEDLTLVHQTWKSTQDPAYRQFTCRYSKINEYSFGFNSLIILTIKCTPLQLQTTHN